MKKKLTTILGATCLAATLVLQPLPLHALSAANQSAHNAHEEKLADARKEYMDNGLKYTYIDLDNDKVDELLIYPGFGYCSQVVYDYQNGQSVQVSSIGQGNYTSYYKKKKVLYVASSGNMGMYYTTYYKFNGSQYEEVAQIVEETEGYENGKTVIYKTPKKTYYVKGKKVKKSKYKSYVKKLTKGDKAKSLKNIKWKTK